MPVEDAASQGLATVIADGVGHTLTKTAYRGLVRESVRRTADVAEFTLVAATDYVLAPLTWWVLKGAAGLVVTAAKKTVEKAPAVVGTVVDAAKTTAKGASSLFFTSPSPQTPATASAVLAIEDRKPGAKP